MGRKESNQTNKQTTTEAVFHRAVLTTVPTTEVALYRASLTTVPTTEAVLYKAVMATGHSSHHGGNFIVGILMVS